MRKRHFLPVLTLFVLHSSVLAQSDSGARDSEGRRTGPWKVYLGGSLNHIVEYKAGLREGKYTGYYGDAIVERGQYAADMRTGEWTRYLEGGSLREKGKYVNGKQSGPWEFYNENGTLRSITNYLDGKKSGLYQSFWVGTIPDEKGNYLEDKKIGEWVKYDYKHETKETFLRYRGSYGKGEVKVGKWEEYRYLSEQLDKLETFDNQGVLNGLYEDYDYSGRLVAKGEMSAGERNGTWTLGEDDGETKITVTYTNGMKNGPYEKTDRFNSLKEKGAYKDDKKDGAWEEVDYSGIVGKGSYSSDKKIGSWGYYHPSVTTHPVLTVEYAPAGVERSRKQYDEQKNLVKDISYNASDGSKSYKGYYPTGQVYEEGRLVADKQEGVWKQYYEDGTLGVIKNFTAGAMNGEFQQFYPSGQIKMTLTFQNGLLWNMIEMKDVNGNKLDGGSLKNGTGTFISYDDNGTLQQVQNVVDGQVQQ